MEHPGPTTPSAAIAAISAAPLLDAHAHVFSADMPLAGTAWHEPSGEAPLQKYLAELDEAGVHFAVLAAASIFGDYNDYALAATRGSPRLRTTVIVHPDVDLYSLKSMHADGAVGIRLQFRNRKEPPDLASFEYRRLFRRIADLGWHVHLHDQGDRIATLIPQLENAGPRLVIDHFGRPTGVNSLGFRAILAAVSRGNTWVKLSASFRLEQEGMATQLADALVRNAGPERLLWGSDWPFVAYEDRMSYHSAIRHYHEIVPDASVRRAIDRTALKFYFT